MRTKILLLAILSLVALANPQNLFCAGTGALEQGELTDPEGIMDADPTFTDRYIIHLSGNVFKERFSGARGILRISGSGEGDNNPYMVIIEGFPKKNSKNTFFWNTEFEPMEALSNRIRVRIVNSLAKPSDVHFFYLSPVLYEQAVPEGHHRYEELKRAAIKGLLPTRVYAEAGELVLNIYASRIDGKVWLKGYDPIERRYVLYNARITGTKTVQLQPKRELGKE